MLWRALNPVTDGFYIDVGAGDPDEDSVTRAFYDRGWCGINIEPSPEYFEALIAARPRDVTLRCLVGVTAGEASLHHFADTGLSTTNAVLAARHVAAGRDSEVIRLPVLTLTEIWRRYASPTVHFLKIDVEGAEADVLRGTDFTALRPWIVLAEATEPGSPIENWFEWDGLLTGADYRFSWFDGLNRFYVAAEHWDALKGAFAVPPNVFDQWIQPRGKQQRALLDRGQAATVSALQAADTAHEAVRAAQSETGAIRGELATMQARAEAAETEVTNVLAQLKDLQLAVTDLHRRLAMAEADHAAARAEADQFRATLADHAAARTEADQVRATLAAHESQWRVDAARMRLDLHQSQHAREETENLLHAMRCSTSWRVTAPMRGLADVARGLIRRIQFADATSAPAVVDTSSESVASMDSEQIAAHPPQPVVPCDTDSPRPAEEERMLLRLRVRARAE